MRGKLPIWVLVVLGVADAVVDVVFAVVVAVVGGWWLVAGGPQSQELLQHFPYVSQLSKAHLPTMGARGCVGVCSCVRVRGCVRATTTITHHHHPPPPSNATH